MWPHHHHSVFLGGVTNLAIFAHYFLQKCSKAICLQVHILCKALFGSPHRFSVGFRSGIWLVQFKTLIFQWSPFYFWCGCILWVVTVLKDEVHLQLSSRRLKVLCQHWLVFGTVHDFPPPWLRPLFQLKKNSHRAWSCHHHASLRVWSSFGDVQCCFCQHLLFWPKSSTLVSSDHNTFSHMLLEDFKCVLQNPVGLRCSSS